MIEFFIVQKFSFKIPAYKNVVYTLYHTCTVLYHTWTLYHTWSKGCLKVKFEVNFFYFSQVYLMVRSSLWSDL